MDTLRRLVNNWERHVHEADDRVITVKQQFMHGLTSDVVLHDKSGELHSMRAMKTPFETVPPFVTSVLLADSNRCVVDHTTARDRAQHGRECVLKQIVALDQIGKTVFCVDGIPRGYRLVGMFPGQRVPVIVCAHGPLFDDQWDEVVRATDHPTTCGTLPALVQACLCALLHECRIVILSADFHSGYAAPIGASVFFPDTTHTVYPSLVGFDIGCGMLSATFPGTGIDQIRSIRTPLVQAVLSRIPTAFKHRKCSLKREYILDVLHRGPVACGLDEEVYKTYFDTTNFLPCSIEDIVRVLPEKAIQKGRTTLGTLGKSNHYGELWELDGDTGCTFHSGSRALGFVVAEYYGSLARAQCIPRFGENAELNDSLEGIEVPTCEFAALRGSLSRDYLLAMQAAVRFAQANRYVMLRAMVDALRESLPDIEYRIFTDCTHNTFKHEEVSTADMAAAIDVRPGSNIPTPTAGCAWPDVHSTEMLVARKGSTSVHEIGHPCYTGCATIGSSMFGGNYILQADPLYNRFFCSGLPHGSGRILSRAGARKVAPSQKVLHEMLHELDIVIASTGGTVPPDEVMEAYKPSGLVLSNTLAGVVKGHTKTCFIVKPSDPRV